MTLRCLLNPWRFIVYNEEAYKNKIAIDDESPLSIHLDHFKKSYIGSYKDKVKIITEDLSKAGATPQKCRAYIFALPDVDAFKLDFAKELSGEHFS